MMSMRECVSRICALRAIFGSWPSPVHMYLPNMRMYLPNMDSTVPHQYEGGLDLARGPPGADGHREGGIIVLATKVSAIHTAPGLQRSRDVQKKKRGRRGLKNRTGCSSGGGRSKKNRTGCNSRGRTKRRGRGLKTQDRTF